MPVSNFVTINGKKIPIQDWSFTLFQLCDSLGIKIPRFCYHERLSIAGNCRMCMVEVGNSLKPVVACATSLIKGMTVYTNSFLAKRARENVLEFLLINHPLDCPICDQGGECDLQDQAIAYGSDKGRFSEVKRSVEDKSFGPIVKTVMTRCIHCTRCVRFFEEISGTPFLGTMGRGKDTEISSYVTLSMLNSNISGNVVDLCPVGALTSKPHAFMYRPWELTSVETIDTTDSLGSSIRVDLKGAEIVRILPKRNDVINSDWISDVTRYGYEGLKKNRLSLPMLRDSSTGVFASSSWSAFYSAFMLHYSSIFSTGVVPGITFCLGTNLDLFTVYLVHFFSKFFNASSVTTDTGLATSLMEFRPGYLLQSSFYAIEASDLVVVYNVDLVNALPVVQARLKKVHAPFLYFGLSNKLTIDHVHVGLTLASISTFYRGKNILSVNSVHVKKPYFLSNGQFLFNTTTKISALNKFSSFSILPTFTDIHANEVGLSISTENMVSMSPSFYYALSASTIIADSVLSSSIFSIYQGSNAHSLKTQIIPGLTNSWYIPSCSVFETRSLYLNLLGYLQITRKCTTKLGLSLSNFDILLNLFIRLSNVHPMYCLSTNFTSLTFYSFFLDFIVVSLVDTTMVHYAATSIRTYLAMDSYYSNAISGIFSITEPTYITASSTIGSVRSLRSYSTF